MGAAGVLAIPADVDSGQVLAMIGDAREFAAEWAELRAVLRNRLHGYCLRAPLKVGCLPSPDSTSHPFLVYAEYQDPES